MRDERGLTIPDAASFDAESGAGIRAVVNGRTVLVGRQGFLEENGVAAAELDITTLLPIEVNEPGATFDVLVPISRSPLALVYEPTAANAEDEAVSV